jgi:hypothetical protein
MLPLPTTITGFFIEIAIAIPVSYVLVSCLEHYIHKRMMHTRGLPKPIYKVLPYLNWILDEHAVRHHGKYYKRFDYEPDPEGKEQNIIIGPAETLSMGMACMPAILPVALFVSPIGAVIFCLTGLAHNYTWGKIHRQMHVPEQGSWFRNNPVFLFLARHHYLHHEYPMKNFNVVMPFADFVFGSVAKPKPVHIKEMLRLGYLKARTTRGAMAVKKLQERVVQQSNVTLSNLRPVETALAA